MTELTQRLSWVVAAPFLALAGLAGLTYTAAMRAAETIIDLDLDDDDEFPRGGPT